VSAKADASPPAAFKFISVGSAPSRLSPPYGLNDK